MLQDYLGIDVKFALPKNFGSTQSNPWWDDVGNGKIHANLETWDDVPHRLLSGSAEGKIASGKLKVQAQTGWYGTRAMLKRYPLFPSWTALKNKTLVRRLTQNTFNTTTKSWASYDTGESMSVYERREMKGIHSS